MAAHGLVRLQSIISQLTEWHRGIPSQRFTDNSVNIGQGWSIIKPREPLLADHCVYLGICLILDGRVENHRKEKRHEGGARLHVDKMTGQLGRMRWHSPFPTPLQLFR
jgi:hypothetical protein